MAREIRISIDDDEVFERMKRRKDELDLSWEEVLRRGLRRSGPGPGSIGVSVGGGGPGPFDEDFGDHIRRQVAESLRESLGDDVARKVVPESPEPPEPPGRPDHGPRSGSAGHPGSGHRGSAGHHGHDRRGRDEGREIDVEIDRLADAEDAVLVFEGVESEDARVPLRVNLTTGREGLDVEVVAVRRGKGTEGQNRFDPGERKTVVTAMARGEPAVLRFGPDESYEVTPELTWGRDGDGHPTVTDVEVVEVHLDD